MRSPSAGCWYWPPAVAAGCSPDCGSLPFLDCGLVPPSCWHAFTHSSRGHPYSHGVHSGSLAPARYSSRLMDMGLYVGGGTGMPFGSAAMPLTTGYPFLLAITLRNDGSPSSVVGSNGGTI